LPDFLSALGNLLVVRKPPFVYLSNGQSFPTTSFETKKGSVITKRPISGERRADLRAHPALKLMRKSV
jgi:hypothetical protein